MTRILRHLTVTMLTAAVYGYAGTPAAAADSATIRQLDSIQASLDVLEQKARSTLMFGGSSPVSFSGEARLKFQFHTVTVCPDYMKQDKSYLQSGWDGNENLVRIAMVARPGRNTVLYSKIGLQHTLVGNVRSTTVDAQGFTEVQTRHDKALNTATIHEDLNAGIAVRTKPAQFWLRLGNTLWTEASPLTIWKSQPRTFAWEYLPFEIEQPIARYYEYNIAKGEKSGRAAWNKKAFNGINLESISLPLNIYANILYGTYERYDNFEREYIDFSNDLAYSGDAGAIKGKGIGDSYRHLLHARIAAVKALKDLTFGLNFNAFLYNDDVVFSESPNWKLFNKVFNIPNDRTYAYFTNGLDQPDSSLVSVGRGFYKEPKIYSFDVKGGITPKFRMQSDIAVGYIDTTWMITDSAGVFSSQARGRSPLTPAGYLKTAVDWLVPFEADIAYIGRGFYSPASFAAPVDAFYAFGSNLLGAGKFIARGEASPYVQNMAGMQLTLLPVLPGYGHLKVKYGQHFQLEESRDLLFFPYRLNGPDLFSFFHSSYNRWGNNLVDNSMPAAVRYQKRLGDESFKSLGDYGSPDGPDAGGLRSDYLAMYEGFVPYRDSLSAAANLDPSMRTTIYSRYKEHAVRDSAGAIIDTISSQTAFLPVHRKYSFNLELDASYDIGPLIGYKNDLFLGGYAAVNGVSTSFTPLAVNAAADETLLWSLYLRFEPAIALGKRFYLVGLLGYENWRSEKAWTKDPAAGVVHAPIDYRDAAYGLGFDWDMLERVGLHGRAKWMKHTDRTVAANNWQTPVVAAEIKMWF